MKKAARILALWFVVSIVVFTVPMAFAVELKYKFVNGAQASYENIANGSMITTKEGVAELPTKFTQNMRIVFVESVKEIVDPTTARIELNPSAITAQVQLPGKTISFDSGSAMPPDPYFLPLSTLIGRTMTTTMTEKGKILQVAGFQALQSSMFNSITSTSLKSSYDADQVINSALSTMTMELPSGDIPVGTSWNNNVALQHPVFGTVNLTINNTLAALETVFGFECARINFSFSGNSAYTPPANLLVLDNSEVTSQNRVGLSGNGTIDLAYNDGIIVKATQTTNITISTSNALFVKGQAFVNSLHTSGSISNTLNLLQYVKP